MSKIWGYFSDGIETDLGTFSRESGEQDVDFLEVEQIPALPLDRNVAARLAVGRGDEPDMPRTELPLQALFGVHPLHHVVQLFGRKDGFIGVGKCDAGHFAYQSTIFDGGFSGSKHKVFDSVSLLQIY